MSDIVQKKYPAYNRIPLTILVVGETKWTDLNFLWGLSQPGSFVKVFCFACHIQLDKTQNKLPVAMASDKQSSPKVCA